MFSYQSLKLNLVIALSENYYTKMTETAMLQRKGSVQLGEQKKAIDITFSNISYSVEVERKKEGPSLPCRKEYDQKILLKNVSGIFKAG